MKIAVCVSGAPRSGVGADQEVNRDFPRNFKNLQNNFKGADFFIGTWRQYESELKKDFPNEPYWLFDMPEAHYSPYLDMDPAHAVSDKMRKFQGIYTRKPELHERVKYQAHQILCHANMVDSLPEQYDVIVRARFDTFTYAGANFSPYLDAVVNNKTSIGFACLKHHWKIFHTAHELGKQDANCFKYLFDSLIMHNPASFDTKSIFELHKQKRLCPAEFGWYQVLSQPHNDNHRCISGWANADRCVPKNFLDAA